MKEGDWVCSNCNVVIFRNKSECIKCHSKKPIKTNSKSIDPLYQSIIDNVYVEVEKVRYLEHIKRLQNDPEYHHRHTTPCHHNKGSTIAGCWKCN